MLSRSDFGLIPLMLWIACLALDRGGRGGTRAKIAGSILAGSVIGLVLVLGHTYFTAGHLAQSSAMVKRRWSSLDDEYHASRSADNGISPLHVGSGRRFQEHPRAKLYLRLTFGSAILLAALAGAWFSQYSRRAITIVFAVAGIIIGYMTLYAYDGAVQPWYFANYLVPYSITAASVFAIPWKAWRAALTGVVVALIWRASPVRGADTPTWPQQAGFYQAGLYLRQHPELKPVGAWNAGISNYVAHGGVVNLDGLVNDNAVPYVLSDSLKDYLATTRIYSVIDDAIMWDSDLTRARGGYAGDVLTRCIDSKITVWQVPNPTLVGNHILLSTLNPQCLGAIVDR